MRGLLTILILASLFFAPVKRVQIAQMQPVKTVGIREENGKLVIDTDCGATGVGESVTAAVENLKRTTPAVIYLDTAKYLLVSTDTLEYVDGLRMYLKGSIRVCITDEQEDIGGVSEYLDVHGDLPELRDWSADNMP